MIEEMGFKTFPKTVVDGTDMTFCGRVCHSREAATIKAQLPVVESGYKR